MVMLSRRTPAVAAIPYGIIISVTLSTFAAEGKLIKSDVFQVFVASIVYVLILIGSFEPIW